MGLLIVYGLFFAAWASEAEARKNYALALVIRFPLAWLWCYMVIGVAWLVIAGGSFGLSQEDTDAICADAAVVATVWAAVALLIRYVFRCRSGRPGRARRPATPRLPNRRFACQT